MNTNAVVAAALVVLACGLVGVSSQAQLTGTAAAQRGADEGFGTDVSAFMQRSAVAANGSVDTGMWTVAFETASNLSRKQVLVRQRAATLDARLQRLEAETEAFPPPNASSVVLRAQRARLAAEREALRNAVSEAKTNAASEGVNATALDELDDAAENLSIPTIEATDPTATAVDSGADTNATNTTVDGTNTTADGTNATSAATTARTPAANRRGPETKNRQRTGATYSGP